MKDVIHQELNKVHVGCVKDKKRSKGKMAYIRERCATCKKIFEEGDQTKKEVQKFQFVKGVKTRVL